MNRITRREFLDSVKDIYNGRQSTLSDIVSKLNSTRDHDRSDDDIDIDDRFLALRNKSKFYNAFF